MSSQSIVAEENRRFDVGLNWVVRIVAAIGALLCVALMAIAGDPIVHGHPTYWFVLGATFIICAAALVRSFWPRRKNSTVRRLGRSLLVVLSIGGLAIVGWLMPAGVTSSGLEAMTSDSSVTVVENATQISIKPTGDIKPTGLMFQPGAKVDARAYVNLLRPLAQGGHVVVIAKQPLGVGFLAMTALDSARSSFPNVTQWVVSGHSLGGTVAALEAQQADADQTLARTDTGGRKAPVVGLILFASYPAGDMSDVTIPVLSISGENDGLSTPDAIAASLPNLPTTTTFIQVPGASHSSFGDYGLQAGDGTATASRTNTYNDITQATVAFVNARD